jgi:DNA polymerase-3 subunit epsilon
LQRILQALIKRFRKSKQLSKNDLQEILALDKNNIDDIDTTAEIMIANGFPMYQKDDNYYLKTATTPYTEGIFCFVDIETNGSKPQKAQIIEIGAIKVQNNKIIDKFSSLIYNNYIPKNIQEITNIKTDDLKDAPDIEDVLKKFKIFLDDSVFIAHAVTFDYNFISYYLEKYNLGKLENRKICSLKFAQKSIKSQKYSLSYFNEYLQIEQENLHRAYNDAYVSYRLFKECLKSIPDNIKSVEDLIKYIH